ncbi:MAG: metallophosphoesterase family protein [Deltaproteobacteria bacterium]|nr:metallophosphoesterase family protein [Deltaproteobacteria bacterium]MBW1927737.1 metallophosphoesterase family protein [Deltaproteobacteria bacterium]MBW2027411.1 metallophosphoesterase family protein [Deltaproteobacteria bacterium]MBW2127375.1 metallophosphoesterase family protein [Deltaproteobacteria bacterium]RLB21028.1 MAG: hypothetical protein DRG76_09865 [Deltaproteobacteria bacterium]
MKIGVISDTHLNQPSSLLEKVYRECFHDVDLILHAGDVCRLEVLEVFKDKRLYVVSGNCDDDEVKKRFPDKQVIEAGGYKIGLVHGWGPPFGLWRRVASVFRGVNCIVFGHSHRPMTKRDNGVLFFNPGAFCGGIFSLWQKSVGILYLEKDIEPELIRVKSMST